MDNQLLLALMNGESKRSEKDDFPDGMGGKVKVFVAEGEKLRVKFWNSSNNESFYRPRVCNLIGGEILQNESISGGSVSIDLNEIMFEIEEK